MGESSFRKPRGPPIGGTPLFEGKSSISSFVSSISPNKERERVDSITPKPAATTGSILSLVKTSNKVPSTTSSQAPAITASQPGQNKSMMQMLKERNLTFTESSSRRNK